MTGRISTKVDLQTLDGWAIPPSQVGQICAAGIDVRPMSWDLLIADVVKPPCRPGDRQLPPIPRIVFAGKMPGEAECLFFLRQYKVIKAVADAGPEGTLVIRMADECPKYGIDFWRARYQQLVNSPILGRHNNVEKVISVEKTMAIDIAAQAIRENWIAFPKNAMEILEGQFASELKAVSRTTTPTPSGPRPVWKKKGPDHAINALAYLLIAFREFNLLDFTHVGPIESVSALSHKVLEPGARKEEDEDEGAFDNYVILGGDY